MDRIDIFVMLINFVMLIHCEISGGKHIGTSYSVSCHVMVGILWCFRTLYACITRIQYIPDILME